MRRSEEISQYITDNIRDPDVIKKANEIFKFDGKEREAMRVIAASVMVLQTQVSVLDCWKDIAEAGKAMLGDG